MNTVVAKNRPKGFGRLATLGVKGLLLDLTDWDRKELVVGGMATGLGYNEDYEQQMI